MAVYVVLSALTVVVDGNPAATIPFADCVQYMASRRNLAVSMKTKSVEYNLRFRNLVTCTLSSDFEFPSGHASLVAERYRETRHY